MLQDLTRSAIVVAPRAASADPDLGGCSPSHLAKLADLAHRAGDQVFAEHCIRALYAAYDRAAKQAAEERRRRTEAARPRPPGA